MHPLPLRPVASATLPSSSSNRRSSFPAQASYTNQQQQEPIPFDYVSQIIMLQQAQINLLQQQGASLSQDRDRRDSSRSARSERWSGTNRSEDDGSSGSSRQEPFSGNLLVASALARRKRESLTLEAAQMMNYNLNGPSSRSPRTSEDSSSLRTPSPSSATPPAVYLYRPDDTYALEENNTSTGRTRRYSIDPQTRLPVRSSSVASSPSSSSPPPSAPTQLPSNRLSSITSSRDLDAGGATRKSSLVAALSKRQRPLSMGSSASLGQPRSVSDSAVVLSPFAPTFKPLPPVPPRRDSQSPHHSRSSTVTAGTITALRQPRLPAVDLDMNFASRIRRRAVGSLLIGRMSTLTVA